VPALWRKNERALARDTIFLFGGFKRRPKMDPRDVWNRWAGRPQEVHVHDYLNLRMENTVIVFPNASPLR